MNILLIDPIVALYRQDWLANISIGSILIRTLLALIIGGFLGYERFKKHHAAGFRTYMLVCLGATIAMITNQFIFEQFGQGDMARFGAQVISGIGFLGAGTILVTSRNQIKGLTTAAGLWACACIGLSIGIGFYTMALIAGLVIVVIFSLLPVFEKIIIKNAKALDLHVEFESRTNLKDFINYLRSKDIKVYSVEYNPAYASSGLSVYTMDLLLPEKTNHESIISEFKQLTYINYVEEIR